MADSLRRRMMMGGKKKRLPDGYTELKYVECNGNQYLNTGIGVTDTLEIEADAWATTTSPYNVYWIDYTSRVSSTTYYYRYGVSIQGNNTSTWTWGHSSSLAGPFSSASTTTAKDAKIHFIQNINNVVVNGNTISYSSSTHGNPSSSYHISIAGRVMSSSSASANYIGYIGEFIMRDDGLLLKDYIPAKDGNNQVGFYDIVNDTFHTSDSGTDFIAGPEA